MGDKIEVVKVEDLRKDFDKYLIPKMAEEIIKRTDKRYFTRNQIYLAGLISLWICASVIISFMAKYPQAVDNITKPIQIVKPVEKVVENVKK